MKQMQQQQQDKVLFNHLFQRGTKLLFWGAEVNLNHLRKEMTQDLAVQFQMVNSMNCIKPANPFIHFFSQLAAHIRKIKNISHIF